MSKPFPIVRVKNGLHHVNKRDWARTVRHLCGDRCAICNREQVVYGDLHAHHIEPQSLRPDLSTALENGICLCRDHHTMAHRGGFQSASRPQENIPPDEMNVVEKHIAESITLILPTEEAQILKDAAAAAGKSLSRFIVDAINQSEGRSLVTVLDDDSKRKK